MKTAFEHEPSNTANITLAGSVKNTAPSWTGRFDVAVLLVCVVAFIILVLLLVNIVPEAFILEYNSFALISIAGLSLDVALLVILIRRPNHSESILWLALFVITGFMWSSSEALQRMATTPVGSAYWGDIIAGVTTFMPASFYLFARSYTNRSQSRIPFWVPASLLGTSIAMGALLAGNNVFALPDNSGRLPWGFVTPSSIVSVLFIIWAGIITFAAIMLLWKFFRGSTLSQDRRQSMIVIVSGSVVMVISALTEVFLPAIGYTAIPPLGVLTNALFALSVIFGIYRYGNFSFGIDQIAPAILSTMGDGVLVCDENYRVVYNNAQARELMFGVDENVVGIDLMARFGQPMVALKKKWETELVTAGTASFNDFQAGTTAHPVIVNFRVTAMDAAQPGFIFVLNDVTQLRVSQNSLMGESKKLDASLQAYEKQQNAMLNLLEDARDLEADLKQEKAGIEEKVSLRTAELTTERLRLSTIINGVDVGIYMLDIDLNVTLVNKPMEALYTLTFKKRFSLKSFSTDLRGMKQVQAEIKTILDNGKPVISIQDHGNVILRTYRAPVFDGTGTDKHMTGIVVVVEDITEAKSLERSRDEFFSIASHELRTPLTAIRGNTSMILDYYSDQLKEPALKEMVDDIHDSSIRLITIVNDFLDTSRLEQGKIEFQLSNFSAAELVSDVINEFKVGGVATGDKLSADLDGAANVTADHDRLKQVVLNLIGNALKFTDTGTVTVKFASDAKNFKIRVIDTGKGIPDDSRGRLFRKFQQASNNILTRDSTRSTGLGLYISKLIMTGMGGKIYLEESTVGKGSIFTLEIPLATSAISKPVNPSLIKAAK